MAVRPAHRWLEQLTGLPTTSGYEERVIRWVRRWASRRSDVQVEDDSLGNLWLGLVDPRDRPPIVVAAHMDHPGFVVEEVRGRTVHARFMGGVRPEYFVDTPVEMFAPDDARSTGVVREYDSKERTVAIELTRRDGSLEGGSIGRWRFSPDRLGLAGDRLRAHACDDLAGVAAGLAALDEARSRPERGHLRLLLTRAEEMGLLGAIGAARAGTVPGNAAVLSIETSRSFAESPIGGGPIVRVGDKTSIFDHSLTNAVAAVAAASGLPHRRLLMSGGTCEATAFGAFGIRATGLCLALGNYHNMACLDALERDRNVTVRPAPEEISVSDFDGLVSLIGVVADGLGSDVDGLRRRLEQSYEQHRWILERGAADRN